MKIEIKQEGTAVLPVYRWTFHTGPEDIDEYGGYCYTLGECFEKIIVWNTINAQHYVKGTENDTN